MLLAIWNTFFPFMSLCCSFKYVAIMLMARQVCDITGVLKADSHIACRAHAVPLPCRAAEGLECIFPI